MKDAPWAEAMERALFAAYDVSAFATQAHIDMFHKALEVSKDDMRVAKVGWPMEYLADELQPFLGVPKENIVLFPHRGLLRSRRACSGSWEGSFPTGSSWWRKRPSAARRTTTIC